MKKLISLTLCLAIVFCSFSFCFADFTSTDSSNLSSIKNSLASGGTIYNLLNNIYGRLYASNNSIAYWVKGIYDNTFLNGEGTLAQICNGAKTYLNSISSKMDTVNGTLAVISSKMPSTDIAGLLAYPDTSGGTTTWYPYLFHNQKSAANWLNDIYDLMNLKSYPYYNQVHPADNLTFYRYRNGLLSSTFTPQSTPFFGAFYYLGSTSESVARHAFDQLNGFNATQNAVNWGNLGTSSFTPISEADGLYKWLSAIQAPVARLSYVLASDEEIDAREAAAANQKEVVDEFIDSTGQASASTNDIGSIADISAGYKQNFGSTASVTGIFDIFNSNNFGWFSSETVQQLDTTTQMRSSSYATPLLDQQIEEINNALGVTNAD